MSSILPILSSILLLILFCSYSFRQDLAKDKCEKASKLNIPDYKFGAFYIISQTTELGNVQRHCETAKKKAENLGVLLITEGQLSEMI